MELADQVLSIATEKQQNDLQNSKILLPKYFVKYPFQWLLTDTVTTEITNSQVKSSLTGGSWIYRDVFQ